MSIVRKSDSELFAERLERSRDRVFRTRDAIRANQRKKIDAEKQVKWADEAQESLASDLNAAETEFKKLLQEYAASGWIHIQGVPNEAETLVEVGK